MMRREQSRALKRKKGGDVCLYVAGVGLEVERLIALPKVLSKSIMFMVLEIYVISMHFEV